MLFRLGIICALLTTTLVYSNQDFDEEEDYSDEDYSDLETDLNILEEEDLLHN